MSRLDKTISVRHVFSGHESFQCRHLWLKKGYDFVKSRKSFNDDDAVLHLGVGKNMVASIRFWMKAFNITTSDDKITDFGKLLLDDDGFDPYIEDEASLWLLHYQLVKQGFASTYSIVFNQFRREKVEFTKENFLNFLKRKSDVEKSFSVNEKTIAEDFSVFVKMYLRSDSQLKDKEENFSGLLTELDLLKCFKKGKDEYYVIENDEKKEIPEDIILYVLLDSGNFETSKSFNSIELNHNSVGAVFAMNKVGLQTKIESLCSRFSFITFNDQAGVKELQFKKKINPTTILEKYYAN
jgi:hypothetical protein